MTEEELARNYVAKNMLDLDEEFEILEILGLLSEEEVDGNH